MRGNNRKCGPRALQYQSPAGHFRAIQFADLAKEEAVARHGVVVRAPARMRPLLQPNVEIMIAAAMSAVPTFGKYVPTSRFPHGLPRPLVYRETATPRDRRRWREGKCR